ncbi:MAG TPA: 50S ribosomal protein L25 [Clostridia bacterium]|nr:50S ribosomal protein L25 [Clostridia bacterium]
MAKETLDIGTRIPGIKAHSLRKQGYVPGIMYGRDRQTSPVMIESKGLNTLLRGAGNNVFFEIALENFVGPVRLKEVQRDPVTRDIIHVDIQMINENQKVKADVPVRIHGSYESGKRGIVLQRQRDSIQVEGFPQHIPDQIDVVVRDLVQGGNIRVGDLEISEELSIVGNMEDVILSAVKSSRLEIENIVEQDGLQDHGETDAEAES